jgi:hypothetical protein
MIKEGIRDAHTGSQEGNEDREWDDEKNQIDNSSDEANPEAGVEQRHRCGWAVARSWYFFFQEAV